MTVTVTVTGPFPGLHVTGNKKKTEKYHSHFSGKPSERKGPGVLGGRVSAVSTPRRLFPLGFMPAVSRLYFLLFSSMRRSLPPTFLTSPPPSDPGPLLVILSTMASHCIAIPTAFILLHAPSLLHCLVSAPLAFTGTEFRRGKGRGKKKQNRQSKSHALPPALPLALPPSSPAPAR